MKSRSTLFASLLIVAMLLLAACGTAAPAATEEPAATKLLLIMARVKRPFLQTNLRQMFRVNLLRNQLNCLPHQCPPVRLLRSATHRGI